MKDAYLIKQKADILDIVSDYTDLERMPDGKYRGCCPIHNGDNKTQFIVNAEKQDFFCFSCNASGSVIDFVMLIDKVDYHDAIFKLSEKYNIKLSNDYYDSQERFFGLEQQLNKYVNKLPIVKDYLIKRGFTEEVIAKIKFGADDNSNLIIPIFDEYGRVISFTKRTFGTGAKYVNEKNNDIYEKGSVLYNLHNAKQLLALNAIYVVEGHLDAISGQQMGLPTVAYCGSDLTKEQLLLLKRISMYKDDFIVYLCPDNDDAGQKRIPKMRDKIKQHCPKLAVHIVKIPKEYKDFNDLLLNNINASTLETVNIDIYCAIEYLNTLKTKEQEYTYIEDYVRTVENPMVRGDIADILSKRWGKEPKDIHEWLKTSRDSESLLDDFKDIDDAKDDLQNMLNSGILNFGFPILDNSVNDVRKGEVIIIAGRPSAGKTYFGIQTALHNVINNKLNGLFFSLEMSNAELYERIIAQLLRKNNYETIDIIKNDDEIFYKVKQQLGKNLLVVDKGVLSLDQICEYITVANSRKFDKGVDFIVIDYIQKFKGSKQYDLFADQVERLKAVAKEFNITIFALSQLNREEKAWKMPNLESLRGAGEIEQVGVIILGLSKPGLDPDLSIQEQEDLKDTVLVNIMKARRDCKIKVITMISNKNESRFYEKTDGEI